MHAYVKSLESAEDGKFFFFVFVVVAGGWGESILPGLDRGASGDLSLQALKSDADL